MCLYLFFSAYWKDISVENLRFSSIFIEFSFSIAVSSLAVRVYGYRSSADDFSTGSVCPGFHIPV